jgi:hypothetical protein
MTHGNICQRAWPVFLTNSVARGWPQIVWAVLACAVALGQTPQPTYVYKDADSPENHFTPSGYMGDCGDIQMDEAFAQNPHSGATAIKVVYRAKGKGPNECSYGPPCRWSGVYWQEPPNNWGKSKVFADKGLNLSKYTHLVFWARADRQGTVKFLVGGITEQYGDSLIKARSRTAQLGTTWQEFDIDLTGADLKHIIGGFAWMADQDHNPDGLTFYIDDIRFETARK